MRCVGGSRLAASAFPSGLEVDAFLFAVSARPADVMLPVVCAYEFNQVTAGLVTHLAGVQGALLRADYVFTSSFSHKFYRRTIKRLLTDVN